MTIDEPFKCETCNGLGRIYRYRINDRRYPVTCPKCKGTGRKASAK